MTDAPVTLKTMYIWLHHQPLKESCIIHGHHLYCPCQQHRPALESPSPHHFLLMHVQPVIYPLTKYRYFHKIYYYYILF